ncbi:MAG: DNA polymerase III sliding clamp (beta) subunit (PCNA family) [Colwellia sp.]|jgi:DNA polymerase III sliding clamp (beta) subunit (PCNA family)
MKKATFDTAMLLDVISSPCNAATGVKDLEIYNAIRFEVKDINGTLNVKCTGNNGKCEVISYTTATEGEDLCFVVEGKRLKALVSTYNKKDPISICVNDNEILLTQNNSKQSIKTVPVDSYPCFNEMLDKEHTKAEVNTDAFLFALERVGFATGTDAKPILMMVNISVKQGSLMFTATSGIVMSQFSIPATVSGSIDTDFSISSAVVSQFLTMKGRAKDTTLSYDKKTSRLNVGNNIINATIANEKYPLSSICKVIPQQKDFVNSIKIPTGKLKQAINRIGITSDREIYNTVLKIENRDNSIVVSQSNGIGDNEEVIELDNNTIQTPFVVGYTIKALSSILNQVKGDDICIKFDSNNTTLIEDSAHNEQPLLIMPCRL